MTFILFSIFCRGRDLSLTQFHTFATQSRTLSLTIPFLTYFKILSRYVLIEKTYQASWSISIDLDAQYVSSFIKVFLVKLFSNTPLCFPEKSTLFTINNMSFTYTYQKCCSAPTHFLVALPLRSYWCKAHEETPCWWTFGVTWFWITWHMWTMPYGQDD